jgi:hypothetical protein
MSIVALEVEDMSNFLCKRFASLASSYFDAPAAARSPAAQVPLENLFRVLEMYKNETFSDESRKGVLALESPGSLSRHQVESKDWHKKIQAAVHDSISTAFAQGISDKLAADELQDSLRKLIGDTPVDRNDAAVARAKNFFTQLSSAL